MEDDAERLCACGGGCRFVVVDAVLLGIAFCDIPDFVACDVASVITLESAVGVAVPSARAAMMLGKSREGSSGQISRGKRSWLSHMEEYEDRKVRASS
jgi:hypothetical protein